MILLLIAKVTPKTFLMGIPLVVAGESVRVWSAGYLSKLSSLVTAGPFALCRNPLYVGSFLVSSGYLVMCNRLDAAVAGVILFWVFHGGAVVIEERLLRDKFGEEFAKYSERVPRFIPKPRRLTGHGEFSVKQLMLNNEYTGVVAVVCVVILFGLLAFSRVGEPVDWLVSLAR